MDCRKLYAITLHRPWPYAIFHLGKRLENRSWYCPLAQGTRLVIHAGQKFDRQGALWLQSKGYEISPEDEHPTGIIGYCTFQGNSEFEISEWFQGPIAWLIADPKLLSSPIQIPGQQRLWAVPEKTIHLLNEVNDA